MTGSEGAPTDAAADLADPDFDKGAKVTGSRAVYRLLEREDERQFVRTPAEADADPDEVDVVIHMGCHSIVTPHIIRATVDVIEALGYSAVAIGGFNNCCGMMDLKAGDVERARQVDANRFRNMGHFSPEFAIMECTACHAKTVETSLEHQSPAFEVVSMIEFLNDHADELAGQATTSDPATIALHDHYDEHRWMPDEQAAYARELLGSLPGVEVVEMEHSRDDRLPCSFLSDPSRYPYDDLNTRIYEECVAAGADTLVTFWHACNRSLALEEAAFPVTVRNYATFVGERLGRSYRDTYKQYVHMGLDGEIDRIVADARPVFEANGIAEDEARRIVRTHFAPGAE
jgi:Fe-S oxidoreductase